MEIASCCGLPLVAVLVSNGRHAMLCDVHSAVRCNGPCSDVSHVMLAERRLLASPQDTASIAGSVYNTQLPMGSSRAEPRLLLAIIGCATSSCSDSVDCERSRRLLLCARARAP